MNFSINGNFRLAKSLLNSAFCTLHSPIPPLNCNLSTVVHDGADIKSRSEFFGDFFCALSALRTARFPDICGNADGEPSPSCGEKCR